ncbi:MAG TPA: putative Fe-S cluster assembly protein SufT [Candidatus Binatia bacterium]
MSNEKPLTLKRDCAAIMIPSGDEISLPSGSRVWLTQSVGSGYSVMTDHGYSVRIDGRDGDALGLAKIATDTPANAQGSVEEKVWNQLRSCFDPEIPVNIVELGLVYDCRIDDLPGGGHKAVVHFTLTAQGCGMGQFIKEDIRKKLLAVPEIREANVELVWDPPWNQSRISVSAKQQLGIE